MNIEKHKNYVKEMMVVFGGKTDEDNSPEPGTEGPPEPEYQAVDIFTNAANDMLKDFSPISSPDPVGAATHITTVDSLDDNSADNPDTATVADDTPPTGDQIIFEITNGSLHIKFGNTELQLGPNALSKLKDYISSFADMQEEDDDSEESDDSNSDDSDEDDSDNENSDESDDEETDEKVEEGWEYEKNKPKWAYEQMLPKGTKTCPKGHPLIIAHGNAHCPTCHRDWPIGV